MRTVIPIDRAKPNRVGLAPGTPRQSAFGLHRDDALFYVTDKIGSTILAVRPDGTLRNRFLYRPYGAPVLAEGPVLEKLFAGESYLADVGLYALGPRLYDQNTGHFYQPDPVVGDPDTLQGFNRYGYALNDPLRYVDPSGLAPCDHPSCAPLPPLPPIPFPPSGPIVFDPFPDAESKATHTPTSPPVRAPIEHAESRGVQVAGLPAILAACLLDPPCALALHTGVAATGAALSIGINQVMQEGGVEAPPDAAPDKTHTADQDAAIQLAKEAKRKGGLTAGEAEALLEQAREAGLPVRGPESHPDRPNKDVHIHIGPINHIPVR